jgi:hypothetical protein
MPLLTTRCSLYAVSLGGLGLALPVFAVADKGGWGSAHPWLAFVRSRRSSPPTRVSISVVYTKVNIQVVAFTYILNVGDNAAVSCMR